MPTHHSLVAPQGGRWRMSLHRGGWRTSPHRAGWRIGSAFKNMSAVCQNDSYYQAGGSTCAVAAAAVCQNDSYYQAGGSSCAVAPAHHMGLDHAPGGAVAQPPGVAARIDAEHVHSAGQSLHMSFIHMNCYAMLCYAMLCYAVPCCTMLCR